MNINLNSYGKLCSIFYDATKKYAPDLEVDFYEVFIKQNPGRVLEAMSGSGRLQIPLIQRGYIVDGVDSSKIMLERCRKRFKELGVSGELYQQSLESLSIPHKYNIVTIAVGSFQLITDRNIALQALKSLHKQMHRFGDLLIDTFVPDFKGDSRSICVARIDNDTVIRLTTRYVFNNQDKIADAFCHYEMIVNGVVEQHEDELIQVVWYSDIEFHELLKESGFEIVKTYSKSFRRSSLSNIVHAKSI